MVVRNSLLSIAAIACVALAPAACSAVGYFNMPTSLQQCFGVGFGPGYHADMVLGPCWKAGAEGRHIRYVRNAFAPPAPSSFDAPTAWTPGCDAAVCGPTGHSSPMPMNHGTPAYHAMPPAVVGPSLMVPGNHVMPEMVPAPTAMP